MDGDLEQELQRIALSVAERVVLHASRVHPGGAMRIDGKHLSVRWEVRSARRRAPILVVAIEHPPDAPSEDDLRQFGLTRQEMHVARLLAERRSNKEIARDLGVTEHTARRHTEKVLLKLQVHRRTAVREALLRARKPRRGRP
jgi:DNA-binding CsgD family transcriptional regulator